MHSRFFLNLFAGIILLIGLLVALVTGVGSPQGQAYDASMIDAETIEMDNGEPSIEGDASLGLFEDFTRSLFG